MVLIRNPMNPPPGGIFFFEHNGERVEASSWPVMTSKMMSFMAKHHLRGFVDELVASYMCPSMPSWYCTGVNHTSTQVIRPSEAWTNANKYFTKNLVPFDVTAERLRVCTTCPFHQRTYCLTCTGHIKAIRQKFNNNRVRLAEDDLSGICGCAKTFESVITSVEYDKEDPMWPNIPKECWRLKNHE